MWRAKIKTIKNLLLSLVIMFANSSTMFVLSTPVSASSSGYPLADTNGDLTVNIFDLSYVVGNWLSSDPVADFNGDNIVSIFDLSHLVAQWGGGYCTTARVY